MNIGNTVKTSNGTVGVITEIDATPEGVIYKVDEYWYSDYELSVLKPTIIIDGDVERHGNWYDIPLPAPVSLKAGYNVVSLGVKTKIPMGYEAHVIARSSTFRKYGVFLANSMGLIDWDYNKPWQAMLYAMKAIDIPAGTRLVQFTIAPTTEFSLVHAKVEDEGRGYSGSTGR